MILKQIQKTKYFIQIINNHPVIIPFQRERERQRETERDREREKERERGSPGYALSLANHLRVVADAFRPLTLIKLGFLKVDFSGLGVNLNPPSYFSYFKKKYSNINITSCNC